MCLGIPGEVMSVRDADGLRFGQVRFAGIVRDVCLDTLPDVAAGDWVLVHVGFAIAKVDREEAQRALKVLEGLGETEQLTADLPTAPGEAP
jgi:hydrogenase expression/formation protein HypC